MSSFYDKSSLVLIPSGTKTSKVFSQKPTNGDGDFDFTRSTAATRVNADGNIEKETQNLLLQSNSFDTTWIKSDTSVTSGQSGYDGTNDAWLLDITAATGFQTLRQTISNSGAQTFSIYAKAGTLDWIRFSFTGGTGPTNYYDISNGALGSVGGGVAKIEDVGNGWYRCSAFFSGSFTQVRIYPATANNNANQSSGNILIQDAQLEQSLVARDYIETTTTALYGGITDNVPRLDYTDSSCPALLLEPQRTNLVYQSEYYGVYAPTRVTLTSNYGISPEGVQNAAAIFNTTENGRHNLNGAYFVATSGTSYVNSVFAKAGTITKMQLRLYSGGGSSIGFNDGVFDLTNGTATGTGAGIESYGNGWYRCYVVDSPTSSASNARFNIELLDDLGSVSYVGSVTDYIEIYGSDISAGSYATSYIPTYGTSVTRNGEVSGGAGNTATFNSTQGVLYAEIAALDNTQSASQYITISDGTYNNRLSILYSNGAANMIRAFLRVGGSSQVDFSSSLTNQKDFNKIAFKYKENDFALWVNGVEVATDTSGSVSSDNTLNDLAFSEIGTSQAPFYGKTKELIYFPTALSDTDLEILTGTYYESYSAMAAALNYTVYE